MTDDLLPNATNLRDYAKSRGWSQVERAVVDRLYVLDYPGTVRQLVFPIDDDAPDRVDAIRSAVDKLAAIEERPVGVILQEAEAIKDDTIGFRIVSDNLNEQAIPLTFAQSVVAGAQQLLLAAASSVLKPQRHHPRLGRAEAQQLLHAANFRHTEPGSFVLKVSCRVTAVDVDTPLFQDEIEMPFVRKTTLLANRALNELVQAIESDTLDRLVERTLADTRPALSSNLCEAVTHFFDESLQNSLQVTTSWSPKAALPKEFVGSKSVVRIQREYFSRIEEVRVALRAESTIHEGTFIGTVEELDGDVGDDGRRFGLVTVFLLLHETDQLVAARLFLNADQYAEAHRAHITDGAYVVVTGKLQSKRQPYVFVEVAKFELLEDRGRGVSVY